MPHFEETKSVEDTVLEPIAIVGMSCRLPGGVDSSSSLWDLLVNKSSVQTPRVPESRFNIDAYLHPNLERPGSFNVAGGYFLDKPVESFDPTFFNMTPIEARWLDPQQRKMLEVTYECLESAGLTMDKVAGSNTAVFVGSFTSDYQQMSTREPDFRHNYAATGVDPGLISNRIGNVFDLNGPSFTINTACSSSIYAIHNACHALRGRDCSAALVGGVNLILTVDQHMNTAKLGILSPTSTCHTFDETADGYGRAEGAGALFLKRLSDAIRDGDPIRGVIRSSAVNTNGKVPGMGITHPSKKGQERVVRTTYEKARLDPSRTAYLECHGTGTPVGDPIESHAVSMAMNDTRSKDRPLLIGAIKANIGHSEAASGIFAVMKAAMMTEAAVIPGVCGLKNLNPAIQEKDWNIRVNRDTIAWPEDFPERRASVSSFGYGGTNGHVIVESIESLYPHYQHGKPKDEATYNHSASRPFLVGLSAHDKATLSRNIVAHAKVADKFYLADLAYTLLQRRTKFPHRAYTIASEQTIESDFALSSFQLGVAPKNAPQLGFIFTGQGAQWAGMGAEAMKTFPSFLATIRSLDLVLQQLPSAPAWTLEGALLEPKETSRVNDAEISQPVCTAVQIAIIDLLAEWNINPSVTVGHSSGEIAAAYAAGRISSAEAIVAAYLRGFAVTHHAPIGAMLAVGLGREAVTDYLRQTEGDVVIACENSPVSVTLSGTISGVQALVARLQAEGIFARELKTGKAYHSWQMDPVSKVYDVLLQDAYHSLSPDLLEERRPRASWVSSVTGEEIEEDTVPFTYWSQNLRSRVLFDSAVATLGKLDALKDVTVMIEVGPHSALSGPFKQICKENQFDRFTYVPSLLRGQDSAVQLLKTAGALWAQNYAVDIDRVNRVEVAQGLSLLKPQRPLVLTDLPPYQWNYDQTFWAEPRPSNELRSLTHLRHDLLGRKVPGLSDRSLVWRNVLRGRDVPWLAHHRLGGSDVFPAAGHLSLAYEAIHQIWDQEGLTLSSVTFRDVAIKVALVVPETDDGIEILVQLTALQPGNETGQWYSFAVRSFSNDQWNVHCEGKVAANYNPQPSTAEHSQHPVDVSELTRRVPGPRWYEAFHRVGFEYGPSFQPLNAIRTNPNLHQAAAQVDIKQESGLIVGESRYLLHPSTIDGCLQLIIISINRGRHQEMPHGVVPINIEELTIWSPEGEGETVGSAVAWTDEVSGRYFNTHTKLSTPSGKPILDVKSLRCVAYEAAVPPQVGEPRAREPYMQTVWKPDLSTLTTSEELSWLLPSPQSEAEATAFFVELADHKKPVKSVTFAGRPSAEVIHAVQSQVPFADSITVVDSSEEYFESIKSNLGLPSTASWLATTEVLAPAELLILGPGTDLAAWKSFVAEDGKALLAVDSAKASELRRELSLAGFTNPILVPVGNSTVLYTTNPKPYQNGHAPSDAPVAIFHRGVETDTQATVLKNLLAEGRGAFEAEILSEVTARTEETAKFIIYDADGLLLSALNEDSFNALKTILTSGKPVLWLTAGIGEGTSPSAAMAQGFLRAVRSEQATAKICLLDTDVATSATVLKIAVEQGLEHIETKDSGEDTEYWLHNNTFHVPRVVPNGPLNDRFAASQQPVQEQPLQPLRALDGSIVEGSLVFHSKGLVGPKANEVQLQVETSELEKSDIQSTAPAGPRIVTGTIAAAGQDLDAGLVNQKAVAYATSSLSTLATVPINQAAIYADFDGAELAATLPSLLPAVLAVLQTGRVQAHDHVLLLPSPLPFVQSIVGLQIAFGFQLDILAASDKEREQILHEIPSSANVNILVSGAQPLHRLHPESGSKPTVIIANDFSTQTQEAWRLIAPLGRLMIASGTVEDTPDVLPFSRGATFLPVSVDTLYKKDQKRLGDLLNQTLDLLRQYPDLVQKAKVVDVTALSDIPSVQEKLASPTATVLQYRYGEEVVVKIQPEAEKFQFSADATYLLVGCLGGLGRSLTSWMMDRGARDFVFLSRSGTDKAEAAALVESIQAAGAVADVFRADASNEQDVARVVESVTARRPIRGVVHAAMVLQDGIFDGMSFQQFQAAIIPKKNGAETLHRVIQSAQLELDFFVMTSSISATLGNPGQANYSAGNSYLDGIAWQRNRHHLPATSLILPMILDVGVVADNENIELALTRKAMYGIDEQEMLRGFETAMSVPAPSSTKPATIGNSQIILGLEPAYLAAAIAASDSSDEAYWLPDARLRGVRAAVESVAEDSLAGSNGGDSDLASTLKAARAEGVDAVLQAIGTAVMDKLSRMLLVSLEQFEFDGGSVASYGIDSMIGAELRNWLFKQFGLDLSFQLLLASTMTVKALSTAIAESMGLLE
ncbi:putative polyketide synthase [Aspergillus steynii IBT 23096]|uniref:Putative polyketide synthase n=1 Tax=Aspergillus steynii IBT 23096 TaxID=1392250 RepID=A0A2I2GEX1_9EURO|nr:putative polyketide synthase [Aspergillus steynii IBT 23096]PLB51426.1 putative polyketide synthase [Aspergillus steynii IBT 23096]